MSVTYYRRLSSVTSPAGRRKPLQYNLQYVAASTVHSSLTCTCVRGFRFSNDCMLVPSSRDYHTVCSPTVRGNEGELQWLQSFPRQTTILNVTVLLEINTVWVREGEKRGGCFCQALCTCSFNLLVQFNSKSLANSPGNQRKTMTKWFVFKSHFCGVFRGPLCHQLPLHI